MYRSRRSVLTAVNNLRELEYRISYNLVSNIRAEEWYRSGKGDPAHDGDCLLLYMFRYPNKHPDLLTYRESDEGKAEVEEVRGMQGSWRSQETVLKETEQNGLNTSSMQTFCCRIPTQPGANRLSKECCSNESPLTVRSTFLYHTLGSLLRP